MGFDFTTIHGRYLAAREVMKMRNRGETDEADKLSGLILEADAIYSDPNAVMLKCLEARKYMMVYVPLHNPIDEGSDWYYEWVRSYGDDLLCTMGSGTTFMRGLSFKGEFQPFGGGIIEKYRVHKTDDGLFFEKL